MHRRCVRQAGRHVPQRASSVRPCVRQGNWANADTNRDNAVNIAADKAIAALDNGGDVWVTEAGQSDVTAWIVERIQAQRPNINTKQRVHVVQHSDWNEDQTTPADLRFTKNNTQHNKIADGNSANNGTPQLTTNSSQYWSRAKGHPSAGPVWTEAQAAAETLGVFVFGAALAWIAISSSVRVGRSTGLPVERACRTATPTARPRRARRPGRRWLRRLAGASSRPVDRFPIVSR